MDIAQEKYQSRQNRDQIDILHDFLPVHLALSLHQRLSVGPYNDRLYAHKTTGIDYPFLPQDGSDQRQDQITCIGINQRRRLHFIHFQQLSQNSTDHKQHHMNQNRHNNGKQKAISYLCGIFNLKSMDRHAGQNQINRHHGKYPAVLCLHDSKFNDQKTKSHNQKQYSNLLHQQ